MATSTTRLNSAALVPNRTYTVRAPNLSPPGHRFQGGGQVTVGEEQLGGRGQDPLLGQRGLGLPQRRFLAWRG